MRCRSSARIVENVDEFEVGVRSSASRSPVAPTSGRRCCPRRIPAHPGGLSATVAATLLAAGTTAVDALGPTRSDDWRHDPGQRAGGGVGLVFVRLVFARGLRVLG